MAAAFSSDGEAVLRRTLDPAAAAPRGDKDEFYEVDRAAAFVRDGGFRKVCRGGGAGAASRLSSASHPVPPLRSPCSSPMRCWRMRRPLRPGWRR